MADPDYPAKPGKTQAEPPAAAYPPIPTASTGGGYYPGPQGGYPQAGPYAPNPYGAPANGYAMPPPQSYGGAPGYASPQYPQQQQAPYNTMYAPSGSPYGYPAQQTGQQQQQYTPGPGASMDPQPAPYPARQLGGGDGRPTGSANPNVPVAMPVGNVMMPQGGDIPPLSAEADARLTALLASMHNIAKALLVMGILGIVPTFAYTVNILAIAAGAIALQNTKKASVLQFVRTGFQSAPAPIHAYNLAIAILAFGAVTFIYCINVSANLGPKAFSKGPMPTNCNYPYNYSQACEDAQYRTGGMRFFVVMFILGVIFSVIQMALALTYMMKFNAVASIVGARFRNGGCCCASDVGTAPTTNRTYVMAPVNAQTMSFAGASMVQTYPQQHGGNPNGMQTIYISTNANGQTVVQSI